MTELESLQAAIASEDLSIDLLVKAYNDVATQLANVGPSDHAALAALTVDVTAKNAAIQAALNPVVAPAAVVEPVVAPAVAPTATVDPTVTA